MSKICNNRNKLAILFSALLLLATNFKLAHAVGVIVSLPGRSVQLKGEVADFGYQFNEQRNHPANLMLPPDENDPYLCTYPSALLENNATTILLNNNNNTTSFDDVALFVSRGECSFEQKARVALEIQQNFTSLLKYVVIYNNDRSNPSQLIRMGAPNLDLPSIGFVAVSTRAGSYALSSILYYADATEQNPRLSVNASNWTYPIDMEEFRSFVSGGRNGANTFYMLRFVLFTVLILAPLLRALYLWWNGGGRIVFRRNENGRITGLQYVPPQPYWFAPSAGGGQGGMDGRERAQLLTEQQVRDLPEITYVKPVNDDDDSDDDDSTDETVSGSDPSEEQEPEIVVAPASVEDNGGDQQQEEKEAEPTNAESSLQESDSPLPESAPTDRPPEGLSTSCTTCSICIDDFEDGEKLTILPKCGHAFHIECLIPWLTVRQGCCPLCKRNVLGPDNDQDDEDEASNADVELGLEMGQIQPPALDQEAIVGQEYVTEQPQESTGDSSGAQEEESAQPPPPPPIVESAVEAPRALTVQDSTTIQVQEPVMSTREPSRIPPV